MDEINKLISPDTQATILQVIAIVTLVMPLLEKVVEKTATKIDDKALDVVKTVLGLVPRIRLGAKK